MQLVYVALVPRLEGPNMMDQLQESVAVVAQPDPFVVQLAGEIDMANAEHVADLATHPDNGTGR